MTGDEGLRARKKRERRQAIESAALALFEADGFDETTVEAIAAAVDIAPRTFFTYFPTKEDVVLADHASRLDRIVTELERRPAGERPWAALRAAFLTVADDYETEEDEIARRFAIMAATPSVHARSLQLQAGWEAEVAAALTRRVGVDATDIGPRLLAAAALAAMRSSLQHWLSTGRQDPLPQLVERCFDQLADGLSQLG